MFLCGSRELVQAVWCEQKGEQGGDVAEQEGLINTKYKYMYKCQYKYKYKCKHKLDVQWMFSSQIEKRNTCPFYDQKYHENANLEDIFK